MDQKRPLGVVSFNSDSSKFVRLVMFVNLVPALFILMKLSCIEMEHSLGITDNIQYNTIAFYLSMISEINLLGKI